MSRIRLNFDNPHFVMDYERITIDELDAMLVRNHDSIHSLSQDISTLEQATPDDWNSLQQTIVVPRREDLIRVKREELDREYERRDVLQKLVALKNLGVL